MGMTDFDLDRMNWAKDRRVRPARSWSMVEMMSLVVEISQMIALWVIVGLLVTGR